MQSQAINNKIETDRSEVSQSTPQYKNFTALEVAQWMLKQNKYLSARDIAAGLGMERQRANSVIISVSNAAKYTCAVKRSPLRIHLLHINDGKTPVPNHLRRTSVNADPMYRLLFSGHRANSDQE